MAKVVDFLKINSDRMPDKKAIICGDESITFKELFEKVMACDEEIINDNGRNIDTVVRMLQRAVKSTEDIPMYIVETSGTTGDKKRVEKYETEVLDFILEYTQKFDITERDIILNQLEFSFDASAKDIYSMVVTGATLCIGTREMLNFPAIFIETVEKYGVTIFQTTPFFIKNISKFDGFAKISHSSLKVVLFVGELMKTEYLNYWIEKLPNVRFVNLYGTSETIGNLLYHEIMDTSTDEYVPLTSTFDRYEISIGEKDELLAYDNVLKKYIKTGDLAYKAGGKFFILGRGDNVRKIRGYRVSLEEIEHIIMKNTCIKDVICEIFEDEVYMLYEANEEVGDNALKASLRKVLPKYIHPVYLKKVDVLPTNDNGKLDRKEIVKCF